MKRFLCGCLAVIVLFSLAACGTDIPPTEPAETTMPPETTHASQPQVKETEPEGTQVEAIQDPGFLYLTVSAIDLTLVGESEDIYIGTVPREEVTWVSNDESVVTFQDGVLTATGVGKTTVYAEYDDQRIECAVGCLAQTQEELMKLDPAVFRAPKRLPPAVSDEPLTFYDDAALLGDSITYGLFQWQTMKGYLGAPTFFVRGGTGINGMVIRQMQIYYRGKEMPIEDIVAESGVQKLFILLGQNDLGYLTVEDTMSKWDIMLTRIRDKSPDVEIYLQSVIPEWNCDYLPNTQNEKIVRHNIQLKAYAEENGYHYVDISRYLVDHIGKMPTFYGLDQGIHLNEEGCMAWMQVLKAYAEYHLQKGDLQ